MSTPMIEVPYGTVTGQYVLVTHDSEDEDLTPDVQPLNGTVTLTPTVPAGRIDGVLAQIAPITLRIFGGQIVDDEDQPGARILATDVDMGVGEWAWKATYKFESGLRLNPVTFKVATGETVSLTDGVIPVDPVPVQIVAGASAYDLAVQQGYVGTLDEWLASLKGRDGTDLGEGADGMSAYELAVQEGFAGSLSAWLDSLQGEPGTDGADGDDGTPGPSAYDLAVANGFVGTVEEWLDSLKGEQGIAGGSGIDTGWVDVSSGLINGTNATLHIRRVGPTVHWRFTNFQPGSADVFYTPPEWARAVNDTGTSHGVYYPQSIPGEAQVEVRPNGNLARPAVAGATAQTWWESGYYILPVGVPDPPS